MARRIILKGNPMRIAVIIGLALLVASPAVADQKREARKALDAGQGFQPSGYQIDGPTWYNHATFNVDGIKHRRDRIDPKDRNFWRDRDWEGGGSNIESAPSE